MHIEICEKLISKHSETTEYIKNWPTFYKIWKLHGQTTPEFQGLRMQNFQSIVFTNIQRDFQICISVPYTKEIAYMPYTYIFSSVKEKQWDHTDTRITKFIFLLQESQINPVSQTLLRILEAHPTLFHNNFFKKIELKIVLFKSDGLNIGFHTGNNRLLWRRQSYIPAKFMRKKNVRINSLLFLDNNKKENDAKRSFL